MKAQLSNINIENQELRADNSALSDLAEQRGYDINKTRVEINELMEKQANMRDLLMTQNQNYEKQQNEKSHKQQEYEEYCV